jgi:NADPH2 dehydrogenase/N-ethylmaleimide reductase
MIHQSLEGCSVADFFDTMQVGDLRIPNSIWMAPMTRARATVDGVPTPIMREYYAQRASAGVIVTEGTYVNDDTCGFDHVPGIYTQVQREAWKPITEAVHKNGGRIFLQLWHCGRVGATGTLKGREPPSPSGVNDDLDQVNVWALLANGSYVRITATPSRAMTLDEVERTIEDFGSAAANAKAAGFDGVEIHAASGYLPHQFLTPTLNRREDIYGGSPENRSRFVLDVFDAIRASYSADRIGVRVSPFAHYNNTRDPDPVETYTVLTKRLQRKGVGYIHAADQNGWFGKPDMDRIIEIIRPNYEGVIVANGGLTVESGAALLTTGRVNAISYGRAYIANPDLAERLRAGAKLAEPKQTGWYATGRDGYTDYGRMT